MAPVDMLSPYDGPSDPFCEPKHRPAWVLQALELQRRHHGCQRQLSDHGAGRLSIQFFDPATHALVADYDLTR